MTDLFVGFLHLRLGMKKRKEGRDECDCLNVEL